jgi:hypothetical protein
MDEKNTNWRLEKMTLSERIVWDIVDEFAKNNWLTEDAKQKWDNSHICVKTVQPITKKVDKRIKEFITRNVIKLISQENE